MNLLSRILAIVQFEKIQFDVETEVKRVLDPAIVADYIIAKGITPNCANEVIPHLDPNFLAQFDEFIERVVIEGSAIPPHVPVSVQKKHYKISGEIWVVHQNDLDPFPSSPHAHNYDQNLAMHLGNGNLYRKREFIATAKRKKLIQLRSLIKSIALPPLEDEG